MQTGERALLESSEEEDIENDEEDDLEELDNMRQTLAILQSGQQFNEEEILE